MNARSPAAPEEPVPPLAGHQQLPPEPSRRPLVPAVYAQARVAEEAVPWTVAQAMPTVPDFGHTPLRGRLYIAVRAVDSILIPCIDAITGEPGGRVTGVVLDVAHVAGVGAVFGDDPQRVAGTRVTEPHRVRRPGTFGAHGGFAAAAMARCNVGENSKILVIHSKIYRLKAKQK
jgi:hypothetical protein